MIGYVTGRTRSFVPGLLLQVPKDPQERRQAYAESYGMGDVLVGRTITGCYPNAPIFDHRGKRPWQ